MIDPQIVIRLLVAAGATSLVGLERSRRSYAIGMRTFGLIGLGGAVAGVASSHMGVSDSAAVSRVLQGMLAGIGFLGAGVIVHRSDNRQTMGVTTAAAIWIAAIMGFVAGLGEWLLVGAALALCLLLLFLPEPVKADRDRDAEDAPSLPRARRKSK